MRNQIGETVNNWSKLLSVICGIAALATPVTARHIKPITAPQVGTPQNNAL